jgi:two-component system NarL family sensor kinase
LIAEAWSLRQSDTDSAETIAKEALQLAQQSGEQTLEAQIYRTIGVLAKYQSDYDKSIESYQKSLALYTSLDDQNGQGQALMSLGTIYRHLSKFESAQTNYLKALSLFESTSNNTHIASVCTNLGNLYSNVTQYDQAFRYHQRALQAHVIAGNNKKIASTYNNLGLVHLKAGKTDSAIIYLEKSREIQEGLNNPRSLANLYNNLGATYQELGDRFSNNEQLQKSEFYYLKCLPIYEALSNYEGLIGSYINLCSISLLFNKVDGAQLHIESASRIAYETDVHIHDVHILVNRSEVQRQLGNHKAAYDYYRHYTILKDSLLNETITEQIAETREKYEAEKREQEIAFLEEKDAVQNQLIAQEQLANDRKSLVLYFSIGGGSFGILALLLLLRNQRLRRKSEQLEAKDQDTKRQTEIADLLRDQEVMSLGSMLKGQEKERKRIAEDLHDNLGSMLSTVKLHFQVLDSRVNGLAPPQQEQFHQAETLLDEACGEVRRIAHDMLSGVLTKFGLVAALEKLKASIEVPGKLQVLVLAYGLDERLDSSSELMLYRVIQELVSNALKHASATEITIQLNRIENTLSLQVEDDGVGFDVKAAQAKDGIGMKNVAARVHSLHGDFHFDSTLGHGSTVTIDIPLT